ncbi:unnamed protein product [Cylindrotheca closterium]|uniref:Uncharacterized protein n=1 Tax=Cylindrotheca closterium TaxID=2856 RepID=A0AAD2PY16_9STRA|nr:unnamed protein product [Cylindrotheca closterium]
MSDDEEKFRMGGRHRGSKRGWQGSSMEMEHQQDSSRNKKSKNVAATDKQQFYNTEVGVGYQAKHVMRQPSKRDPKNKVVDMTGGKDFKSEKKRPETKKFENVIECKGLRDFRREIEKILNSVKNDK